MQALTEANNTGTLEAVIGPVGVPSEVPVPDRMVRLRLGPFAGLYYSLRAKHPPAAAHCLRVAIGCSKWAAHCGVPESLRDVLEIAGLLHDIGKIAVPDLVLQKPEALTPEEHQVMELTLGVGVQILSSVGASELLLETVQQARMLKIVDAYDSMTSLQIFRPALSKEAAVAELFSYSGTQFDPELVKSFAEIVSTPRPELEDQVAKRWLTQLQPNCQSHFQGLTATSPPRPKSTSAYELFHYGLLESLPDATIFLDGQGKILHWNKAAEALSGRTAESVLHRQWSPKLMGLLCDQGQPIDQSTCPLQKSLITNTKYETNLIAVHTSGRSRSVVVTSIPLFTDGGKFAGFVVLLRDDSLQNDLEQKVRTLHAIATQDPLTKVANRTELNRRLQEFVTEHSATGIPGSVIMCDIDFFKRINDNFSHQAGDEALVTFASILRNASRNQDLVARYGGEEIFILCERCDINSPPTPAETLRAMVERTPVPALKGKTLTSSFGVTQLQPGDDAETLLARADRALMTAKETGRNRVVQLGVGQDVSINRQGNRGSVSDSNVQSDSQRNSWLSWFTGQNQAIRKAEYLSSVPMEIAVGKLQGFIQDHKADVLSTTPTSLSIQIKAEAGARRRDEHPVPMIMNIEVKEVQYCAGGRKKVYQNRTLISASVHPVRARDRRPATIKGQAQQVLLSFQSYIVGQEVDDEIRSLIILPR